MTIIGYKIVLHELILYSDRAEMEKEILPIPSDGNEKEEEKQRQPVLVVAVTEENIPKKPLKFPRSDFYSVQVLLPDKDYSENIIHFGDVRGKGAGHHLVKALTKRLFEDKSWLTAYNESHLFHRSYDYLPDVYDFSLYKGEVRDVNYIKRDIAIRVVSDAIAETFEDTPLGEKIKRVEEAISKFLVTEYSKATSEKEARLYVPGQQMSEKMEGEKDYAITFSPLFDLDSDSLKGDISFNLNIYYYGTIADTVYGLKSRELNLNMTNEELNKYVGVDFGLFCTYSDSENELTGQMKVSLSF